MRAEADQRGIAAEFFARQLTDVELAAHRAHLGVARIADMRVVRPYDRFRSGPAGIEQRRERLEHVGVAQIPRLRSAVKDYVTRWQSGSVVARKETSGSATSKAFSMS